MALPPVTSELSSFLVADSHSSSLVAIGFNWVHSYCRAAFRCGCVPRLCIFPYERDESLTCFLLRDQILLTIYWRTAGTAINERKRIARVQFLVFKFHNILQFSAINYSLVLVISARFYLNYDIKNLWFYQHENLYSINWLNGLVQCQICQDIVSHVWPLQRHLLQHP